MTALTARQKTVRLRRFGLIGRGNWQALWATYFPEHIKIVPDDPTDAVERITRRDLATFHFDYVDAYLAVCDQRTFGLLGEYNTTLPTGKTDGKVWKMRGQRRNGTVYWILREYIEDGAPQGGFAIYDRALRVAS